MSTIINDVGCSRCMLCPKSPLDLSAMLPSLNFVLDVSRIGNELGFDPTNDAVTIGLRENRPWVVNWRLSSCGR